MPFSLQESSGNYSLLVNTKFFVQTNNFQVFLTLKINIKTFYPSYDCYTWS